MHSLTSKTTLRGPDGIRVHLDPSECCPDDPGQGTPIIVECGNNTGTLTCVIGEGEIEGTPLTNAQREWLWSMEDELTAWESAAFDRVAA